MMCNRLWTTSLQRQKKQTVSCSCSLIYITSVLLSVFPDLPPLGVHFINDSPRVGGDTVEVDFELTRPAASVTCQLNKEDVIDCKS